MSNKRHRRTPPAQQSQPIWKSHGPQLAILGGVALLAIAILLLKNRGTNPPAVADAGPQVTATLPEAVGQTQATAELQVADSQGASAAGASAALPNELPEVQLERLLIAGQPTLAFFHSNNCVQCIKMMEVVADVYPEFDESVALVDVNVYDKANTSLLQRAGIRAIPTQIFFDQTGKGMVILGAMTPDQFREQMQALAGGQ